MGSFSNLSDQELLRVCRETNDPAAWAEFVRRFQRSVAGAVLAALRRVGDRSADADDFIQETFLKCSVDKGHLFSNFDFRHPSSLRNFLAVVARNVVHAHYRAQNAQKRDAQLTDQFQEESEQPADMHTRGEARVYLQLFLNDIERHLAVCTEGPAQQRNRIVFWLHHREGLTAAEIAILPDVSLTVKGVESLLHRIKECLKARLGIGDKPGKRPPKDPGSEGIEPSTAF